ncbi:MAG: hypothetical protein WKI46_03715 [Aquificaceae bacterium]
MKRNLVGRENFRFLKPEGFSKLFFFLMVLYTFYNLFLSQYNVFRVFELKKASVELDAKISRQRAENSNTEQVLELIRENPEHFKEKFAREYMQLQREGEYILLFRH